VRLQAGLAAVQATLCWIRQKAQQQTVPLLQPTGQWQEARHLNQQHVQCLALLLANKAVQLQRQAKHHEPTNISAFAACTCFQVTPCILRSLSACLLDLERFSYGRGRSRSLLPCPAMSTLTSCLACTVRLQHACVRPCTLQIVTSQHHLSCMSS
jgi:hypothetical protein